MSKEGFRERFSDDPRRDDLTILAPKQDDPTEQVQLLSARRSTIWPAKSKIKHAK